MKTMKVFDCQDMPGDLGRRFLALWDNKCNDVYVDWTVDDDTDPCDTTKEVDRWLTWQGAVEFERVIIRYWW